MHHVLGSVSVREGERRYISRYVRQLSHYYSTALTIDTSSTRSVSVYYFGLDRLLEVCENVQTKPNQINPDAEGYRQK